MSPSAVSLEKAPKLQSVERTDCYIFSKSDRYYKTVDIVLGDTRLKLKKLVGHEMSVKPSLYIVNNIKDFNYLVGGNFPEWGAAAAYPVKNMMILKSPESFNVNKPIEMLLAHEYAHLVLHDGVGLGRIPRWFDEGVAMMVSTEWSWSDNIAMNNTAVFGDFIPLEDMKMMNSFNGSKAHVAYAQSYLAVKYLINNYGDKALQRFFKKISENKSIDDALMAACGANLKEFELEYNQYLKKTYNLVSLLTDMMFFWIGLAVVVVVGFFLQYNKRRKYYKKWEEQEKYQSSNFDYGDP